MIQIASTFIQLKYENGYKNADGIRDVIIIKDFVILDIQKNLLKIISLKLSLNMNSMIF